MKIKISLFFIVIMWLSSINALADNSNFQYIIVNSEVKITGLLHHVEELIIPSTIEGYKVTVIGESAFENRSFNSILIPDTVKIIEAKAFLGTSIIKDKTIHIPASVIEIGSYAFSYMRGVEAFMVDENNKGFTSSDGVLYDAGKKMLINYPLNKLEDTFIAPEETSGLYCTAFANCTNLKYIVIPSENVWMAGYTFFGCDLILFGNEGTNLYHSINGLAEEDYSRGKVKFVPIDRSPLNMEVLSVFYGMNTDFIKVPIYLTDNPDSNYISISSNIPEGKYFSSSASMGTISNISTDGKGAFSADYFSPDGFENSIVYLTYDMGNIMPGKSIECMIPHKNPSNNTRYNIQVFSFIPLELYTDCLNHWAKDDIFKCKIDRTFWWIKGDQLKPELPITRAEFISSLSMICNNTLSDNTSRFVDVPSDAWYISAINWAVDEGIIKGVGNNMFTPDNAITREEVAVILKRALDYKNVVENTQNYKEFVDDNVISEWAKKSVRSMRSYGLMNGDGDNKFKPKELTTRAETAVLLRRFSEYN
ncbi:MAG: hypothetical protein CVV02_08800 [Firmicutes bacterium HGW-Firmicutes-7]|nr:MAG: hypothetical protein CVV02_08800 [Firmicutes bacterium HGW-Firmicutes-7]